MGLKQAILDQWPRPVLGKDRLVRTMPMTGRRWQVLGIAPESVLLVSVAFLVGLGWVMVTSASTDISAQYFDDSFHYCKRHGVFLVLGVAVFWGCAKLPLAALSRYSIQLMLACLVLLGLLFMPGFGHQVNGSTRWLNLIIIKLQVAELAKASVIVFWASILSRFAASSIHNSAVVSGWWLLPACSLVAATGGLILLQPDLGAVFVLAVLSFGLLFLAGLSLRWFLSLGGVIGGGLAFLIWIEPYRLARVMAFLDPWKDPYSTSYQLTQSLIAFGRGGLWGHGLGSSIQKNFYLPEAHTDFIFAVLCEEIGLMGGLAALLIYMILLGTIYSVGLMALRLKNVFGAFLCFGVALLLATQVLISIGVNTGMLPTKGLTLPFISYGGTSLVVCLALCGLVYGVQRENRERLGWPRAYMSR